MGGTTESASPAVGTPAVAVEIKPLVVNIRTARTLLGEISERAVYRLMDSGDLESTLVGEGRRVIFVDSINSYLRRERKAG